METANDSELALTEQEHWDRINELFDRLLEGAHPETVFASEPDAGVRQAVKSLWHHHERASEGDYLGGTLEFELVPILQPGQLLLNRFRIEKMLGSGGMGEVYLAFDDRIGEAVALKTVARLLAPSPAIRRRFVEEVQNARRVTHSHVCRIHELFEEGELVFFTMEYVEGRLLSAVPLATLGVKRARQIVRQLAEGLFAAHSIGVVHGDFKPSNVILRDGENPRAVIMDFGLARAVDRPAVAGGEAMSFQAGSEHYMAPELQEGGSPSIRSDIFAFGKVALELLPGDRVLRQCIREQPQARPESLARVIDYLGGRMNRRFWVVGGVVSFGGLSGYLLSRESRSSLASSLAGSLSAGTRLLLNGFRSLSGELQGLRLARSVMLTALQQSPHLHAIADQDAIHALQRIHPGGSLPVSDSLLMSLLKQVHAAFWIDGDLKRNGSRYSLILRVSRASDRLTIVEKSLDDLPNLVVLGEQAALWLRQESGESDQSLAANPAQVTRYTSRNPDALEKYYRAMEYHATADMAQAVPLFEEAIRLDPDFAQAHSMLGMSLRPAGHFDRSFEEVETALRLSAKLPERERASIETAYFVLTQDPVKMVESARRNVGYYPGEPRYYRVLAQALCWSGAAAESIEYNRKALELAPDEDLLRLQLIINLAESGDFEQALREYQIARAREVRNPWIHRGGGFAFMGLERYAEAAQAFESEPPNSAKTADIQIAVVMRGDLEAALAAMREQRAGALSIVDRHQANEFLCGLYYLTDRPESARRSVADMAGLPRYPTLARQTQCTAFWAARTGADAVLAEAHAALTETASRWPNAMTQAMAEHSGALAAWRRNAFDEAETLLLSSLGRSWSVFALFDTADFYGSQGKWALAEQYWHRLEEKRGTTIEFWFPGTMVLAWLKRAQAAHNRFDRSAAHLYAGKVLDHWGTGNPHLQVVQAARKISSIDSD